MADEIVGQGWARRAVEDAPSAFHLWARAQLLLIDQEDSLLHIEAVPSGISAEEMSQRARDRAIYRKQLSVYGDALKEALDSLSKVRSARASLTGTRFLPRDSCK